MTDATLPFVPPIESGRRELSRRGSHHHVVARDHRSQAHRHPLRVVDHRILLHRRRGYRIGAARARQPDRAVPDIRRIQPPLYDARHHHGVVFSGAVDPGDHGQLSAADDDWRARRGVSASQTALLVSLRDRGGLHGLRPAVRRRRYRLDVLPAVFIRLLAFQRYRRGYRRFCCRLFVNRHRR